MSSLATWGSYAHTSNEINLVSMSRQTRYSPRNKKLSRVDTIRLEGEFIYTDTATILTNIAAAEAAYAQDLKDFTYTVSGSLAHSLRNTGDCISGVRVIQRSFPKGTPEQLATTRTFSVTLQATYDTAEENLVSWQESIETIGTGGPKWFVIDTSIGPFAVFVSPTSAQYFNQSGTAVGYNSYVNPPGPVNSDQEFGYRRRLRNGSGRNMGQQIRFYTTSWSYFMARDPNLVGQANYTPSSF